MQGLEATLLGYSQEGRLDEGSRTAELILAGKFIQALHQPELQGILGAHEAPGIVGPEDYFSWARERLEKYVLAASADGLQTLLLGAVACTNMFVQNNLTGPIGTAITSPIEIFARHVDTSDTVDAQAGRSEGNSGLGYGTMHPHELWTAAALQFDGEETVGRCSCLQYLLLAETILMTPLLISASAEALSPCKDVDEPSDPASAADGDFESEVPRGSSCLARGFVSLVCTQLPSWLWWSLRVTSLHQQLLAGKSPTLLTRAGMLVEVLQAWILQEPAAGTLPPPSTTPLQGCPDLQGALSIELALLHYRYGHVDKAQRFLVRAGQALGLEVELSGAMGKRTAFQVDAKAQMVVLASRSRVAAADGSGDVGGLSREQLGLNPESRDVGGEREEDVFAAPVLFGEDGRALESRYSSLEQALLLAWCTHVKKGTSRDELQAWQMAPYVEAVISQPRSHFLIQASAMLHKARHERTRTRTQERALMSAEQLSEALSPPSPSHAPGTEDDSLALMAAQRLRFAFSVWFPLHVVLKKEVAEHYISMGLISAALRSLEELELWDALITCYRLLDKKHLAGELIHRRLEVTPDDPKLWNALGDLHMEDAPYLEAWTRSGGRNARSKRSLGRSALRRRDYASAAEHLEAAVALNPLNVESWFSLGYCYVKLEKAEPALRAFTRVTQQDPEHGEAWNNIAAIWVQLDRNKEAFSALGECVKHKRDSWQVWENYASVAVKCCQYTSAVRGLRQVLDLSAGQKLKVEVLQGVLEALEQWGGGGGGGGGLGPTERGGGWGGVGGEKGDASAQDAVGSTDQDEGELDEASVQLSAFTLPGLPLLASVPLQQLSGASEGNAMPAAGGGSRAVAAAADERNRQHLLASVGAVLKQAVNASCCTPEVRGLTTTSFKSDEPRFEAMAMASLDLCRTYAAMSKRAAAAEDPAAPTGSARDLAAARMHLRGVIKQCEPCFAGHRLLCEMQALLEEVVCMEEAVSASCAIRAN